MGTLVECDTALDSQGNEIQIEDAASGAQGYFCPSCGAEMVAYKKRRRNESHFQHRPRFKGEEISCVWANETYRHKVAKQILQRLKCLKVPALYAIRPLDFEGPVDCILPEAFLEVPTVLAERCIFEDEQGKICFARHLEFEEYEGEKVMLVKPDITFCDAQHEPVLFVEIYVTHSPDDQKLARLARLRIPTLEIRIPPYHFEADIQRQFTHSTSHSEWLYHPQQYVHSSDDSALGFTGGRGTKVAKHQGRVFGPGESVKCRTFQVEDALRGVRKRLAGTEYAERTAAVRAQQDELRAEEARITALYEEWQVARQAERSRLVQQTERVDAECQAERSRLAQQTAGVDAELRTAYRKVNPEVQRRVAAQNQQHRAAETALEAEESELAEEQKRVRADLSQRFQNASKQLSAASTEATREYNRVTAELQAAKAALRSYYAEHDELCRAEEELDRAEAALGAEEASAAAELRAKQESLEEQNRAAHQTAAQLSEAYRLELELAERKRLLTSKEDQARTGRLAL